MMKQLNVPFITSIDQTKALEDVSIALDQLPKHLVDMVPWPNYDYKPNVGFSIAHSNDCLFLKFYVSENIVRAVYCNANDPVHKDSCVEFFIAFNDEKNYYNLEFNCIGTCHAGYGADRYDRKALSQEILHNIKTLSVFKQEPDQIDWELTLKIPVEIFSNHRFTTFSGIKSTGNFFKCGDDLPKPHYLAWNDIKVETPNFHLSEYFGNMEFK